MKLWPLIALASTLSGGAAVFTFDSSSLNLQIPDNDPSGILQVRDVPETGIIYNIRISLQIDGGSNGDNFVYLSHGGRTAILLNRVGRDADNPSGYTDPGMNITLGSSGNVDMHTYRQAIFGNDSTAIGGPLTSDLLDPTLTLAADGRTTSPLSVVTSDPRNATLSQFVGKEMSGEWRLFVADLDGGSVGTLKGWSIEVTTVPEPAETATITAAILLCGVVFLRHRRGDN